jgi:integrase
LPLNDISGLLHSPRIELLNNHLKKGVRFIMTQQPSVKLLDLVRQRIRLKGYSIRTEKSYTQWIRRFIFFHNKRHPKLMGKTEIEAFLSHLVIHRNVSPSTQNQAFNALIFLYKQVLEQDLPDEISAIRSKKPVRIPTVMSRDETRRVFHLAGCA